MKYDTKNKSTEQISEKAQKVHTMKNATLNIIMWLLAFVMVLTIMAVLPMPNDNKINVNNAVAQGVADDGSTATAFAGGTGTEEDPYQIATPMQLRLLSETTDYSTYWGSGEYSPNIIITDKHVYYELTADLEMTSTDWTPIGNGSQTFFGSFDGQGHTITFVNQVNTEGILSNLNDLVVKEAYSSGLFGIIAGGNISNLIVNWEEGLIVENSNEEIGVVVGGITSYIVRGSISNCNVTGSVSVTSQYNAYVGGIAGYANVDTFTSNTNATNITVNAGNSINAGGIIGYEMMCTISNCHNIGNLITSNGYSRNSQVMTGGISGCSQVMSISNCYNTGNITVTGYAISAGGITGYAQKDIVNCYNTGSLNCIVEGAWGYIGGVVGSNQNSVMVNCFSVDGSIEVTSETIERLVAGGIVGDIFNATITNCYYDNELTGTASTTDGTRVVGLSNLMKVESNFTSESFSDSDGTSHSWSIEPVQGSSTIQTKWDFENTWGIDSSINNGYPYLLEKSQTSPGEDENTSEITITNDSEEAVLVVISSDGSTAMFKVQGGAAKIYTIPIALDTSYKVSVIGGAISGTPTISGGEITDQLGNVFNVTFTENGSLGINV